jgi:hypothetical protein
VAYKSLYSNLGLIIGGAVLITGITVAVVMFKNKMI